MSGLRGAALESISRSSLVLSSAYVHLCAFINKRDSWTLGHEWQLFSSF